MILHFRRLFRKFLEICKFAILICWIKDFLIINLLGSRICTIIPICSFISILSFIFFDFWISIMQFFFLSSLTDPRSQVPTSVFYVTCFNLSLIFESVKNRSNFLFFWILFAKLRGQLRQNWETLCTLCNFETTSCYLNTCFLWFTKWGTLVMTINCSQYKRSSTIVALNQCM